MTDDEDDPFDEFERPDEDDDPFADLDADTDDSTDSDAAEDGPVPVDEETDPGRLPDDPFTNRDADGPERPPGIESASDAADGDPASPDTTARNDESEAAATGGPGSVVNEPSVPESGGDDPFADLGGGPQPRTRDDDGDGGDDPFDSFESVDVDEVDPDEVWANLSSLEDATEEFDGKVYYEVSKHRFCEQCEYFSGPAEASCTFEGAEVVEFVDMETVRLVNCPVVAEQEDLGEDVTRYEPE
jgi:hypothetical protein